MKRKVHVPALIALIFVSVCCSALITLMLLASLNPTDEIRCGHSGYTVPACNTDFGTYIIIVALVAAPLIAGLVHKAFFTEFKRSKPPAA